MTAAKTSVPTGEREQWTPNTRSFVMHRTIDLESLETRRLFAELTITGTPDTDHITVWVEGSDYVVGVNFVNSYHPIASVDGIRISALGGRDGIIVGDTHDAVTVTAGAGDDELY